MSDEIEIATYGGVMDVYHPTDVFQGERAGRTLIKIRGFTNLNDLGAPSFGLGDALRVLAEFECYNIAYYIDDDPKSEYYGELTKVCTMRPIRAALAAWTDSEDDDGVRRA